MTHHFFSAFFLDVFFQTGLLSRAALGKAAARGPTSLLDFIFLFFKRKITYGLLARTALRIAAARGAPPLLARAPAAAASRFERWSFRLRC